MGGSTLPGAVRRAPLGVADGDGMDRPYSGAAAPGENPAPRNTFPIAGEESGKWQMKTIGKSGKMVMVICLE